MPKKNVVHSKELCDLNSRLQSIYSRDTAYLPDGWSPGNPTFGHCAVVALLVEDHFGGIIAKVYVDGMSHYFNIIGLEVVDLTAVQFGKDISYTNFEHIERCYLEKNQDTYARYMRLRTKLTLHIEG